MTTCIEFTKNKEIADVLCGVIDGNMERTIIENGKPVKKMGNTAKSIKEGLWDLRIKAAQSAISEKLGFLVSCNIIIKNKWEFEPNWKEITFLFQHMIKDYISDELLVCEDVDMDKMFEEAVKIDMVFEEAKNPCKKLYKEIIELKKDINNIFDERRVKMIMERYANYFMSGWLEKMSLKELADSYLDTLKITDTTKFRGMDSNIIKIKDFYNRLDIKNMKEDLFITVEDELK